MNLDDDDGKNKSRAPWFKCNPVDWTDKTRGLSLEQRGAYFDCLCILYRTERPIPNDDKWIAHQLHTSPRMWRGIKEALLAGGFLTETPDGLINKRAMEEIASRAVQCRKNRETAVKRERAKRETSANQAPKESENPENASQINETAEISCHENSTNRDLEREEEREKDTISTSVVPETAREAAALPRGCEFYDQLEGQLREACNGALASGVNGQGLFDLSIPIMWIKSGADMDLDVLPTLRGIGKREHGKQIGSWSYFTKPVAEAKARREAGLPEVNAGPGTVETKQSAYQLARAQIIAGGLQ